jgi:hypothetical protein
MLKIKAEGSMGRYPPRAPPAGDCPLEAPHRLRLAAGNILCDQNLLWRNQRLTLCCEQLGLKAKFYESFTDVSWPNCWPAWGVV